MQGITVDAAYPRIWLTLGFVQQGVGDVSAARVALARAAKLDPQSVVGREAKRMLAALPK
jgi:cytochrome c-type biogenesis protein CcmH/NrfG